MAGEKGKDLHVIARPDHTGSHVASAAEAADAAPRHADTILPEVYNELRRLARARLGRVPAGQTLQPTALVHEAYLKLAGSGDPGWSNRAHFFAAAARAIFEIMVDHARARARDKRGGRHVRVPLDSRVLEQTHFGAPPEHLIALHDAITHLHTELPDHAEAVMLRYFAGLSNDDIAGASGVTTRTVERRLRFARAWLSQRLAAYDEPGT